MKTPATRIAGLMLCALSLAAMVPAAPAQEGPVIAHRFKAPPPDGRRIAEPQLDPVGAAIDDWQARWELARLLSYVKRYEESIAAYRRLLDEKPELIAARAEMANVLVWRGQRKEAGAALAQIPFDRLSDADRLTLGDIYAGEKHYAEAAAVYAKILARRPEEHDVRLRLAEVLSWQQRYDASLAEYRKLVAALPGDVQVRRKFALTLSWAGRRDEAIAELKKTLPD